MTATVGPSRPPRTHSIAGTLIATLDNPEVVDACEEEHGGESPSTKQLARSAAGRGVRLEGQGRVGDGAERYPSTVSNGGRWKERAVEHLVIGRRGQDALDRAPLTKRLVTFVLVVIVDTLALVGLRLAIGIGFADRDLREVLIRSFAVAVVFGALVVLLKPWWRRRHPADD